MKNKKICDWSKSEIKENKELLFSLIKDPTYYCKKCARATNCEIYICKSQEISKVVKKNPTTDA